MIPTTITYDAIINIVGSLAAICMVCGYLPQAIYTIRTGDTEDRKSTRLNSSHLA